MSNKIIIDISEHNGRINFNYLEHGEVAGVIIRMGYGDDVKNQDDELFERNYNECKKRHIPVGAYFYTYCNSENHFKSEKSHIQRLLKNKTFDLPIYIDFEDKTVISMNNSQIKYYLINLMKYIKLLGHQAGIYASLNIWESKLNSKEYDNYFKWIAQYNDVCQYKGKYNMWQYTSHYTMQGINGFLDCSYINTYDISLNIDKVISKYKAVIPRVLDGEFGNGSARRIQLEHQGFNHAVVQGLINEIL